MATYRIDCCNFDLIKDGRNFDKTVILSFLTTLVFRFQKHCNSPQANINTVNSVGNLFSSYKKTQSVLVSRSKHSYRLFQIGK